MSGAGKGVIKSLMASSKSYDLGWAIIQAAPNKEGLQSLIKLGLTKQDAIKIKKFTNVMSETEIENCFESQN